jgi:hypothetical protein
VEPGSLELSNDELKIIVYVKEHGSIRRGESQKLLKSIIPKQNICYRRSVAEDKKDRTSEK